MESCITTLQWSETQAAFSRRLFRSYFGGGEGGLVLAASDCYHVLVQAIVGSLISSAIDLRLFEEINLAVGGGSLLFEGRMNGRYVFTKIGPMHDPGGTLTFVMNKLIDLDNQGVIDTLENTEIHIRDGGDLIVWGGESSTLEA